MKILHKACSGIEEVPFYFPRSSVKFQVHTGQKTLIFTQVLHFPTVTLVWLQWWLWNDAQSLTWYRRGSLLFLKVICQISRSQGKTISNFDCNWAFLDCNSSFDSPMALKSGTKLDMVWKSCPIVFLGNPSNFKVTRTAKPMIWIKF